MAAGAPAPAAAYSVLAWGYGKGGQLGDGLAHNSDVAVETSELSGVTAVAAGGWHNLALLEDGNVMAWGGNLFGELGIGRITNFSDVPVEVPGIHGASAIASGAYNSFAVVGSGEVLAWGENAYGELGDGSSTGPSICQQLPCSTSPVSVNGLTGVGAIVAGGADGLALLKDGTVKSWGRNDFGQLGDGTATGPSRCYGGVACSTTPVAVSGLSAVRALAAGLKFNLALLADGTVMAWGDNAAGELGNGTTTGSTTCKGAPCDPTPSPVSGLSNATAVAAGGGHALALLANGSVMAWGNNTWGQLGDGTTTNTDLPVQVSGLTEVVAIAAGRAFSLAVLKNGDVMAWGNNVYAQLGDGARTGPDTCTGLHGQPEACSTTPVLVRGLSQASGVSGGFFHALAYGQPLPRVTSVSPDFGPTSGGTSVTISGARFGEATAVEFGGVKATSFTVISPTSITAVSPPEAAGSADVTVTTAAGTSPPTPADQFSYGPPTVTKVSPPAGPVGGATTVTITGTGFTGVTAVDFGGVGSSSYKVNSATSITAVSPPEPAGAANVTVKAAGGTSAISSHDRFKFQPTVTRLNPSIAPPAGGTSVTVSGAGFAPGTTGTTFRFGATRASTANCESSTSCTVTAPAHEAGTVNVTATVNNVSSPKGAASQFTYE